MKAQEMERRSVEAEKTGAAAEHLESQLSVHPFIRGCDNTKSGLILLTTEGGLFGDQKPFTEQVCFMKGRGQLQVTTTAGSHSKHFLVGLFTHLTSTGDSASRVSWQNLKAWTRSRCCAVINAQLQLVEGDQIRSTGDLVPFYQL